MLADRLPLLGLNLVSLIPAFTGHAGLSTQLALCASVRAFSISGHQLARRKSNFSSPPTTSGLNCLSSIGFYLTYGWTELGAEMGEADW